MACILARRTRSEWDRPATDTRLLPIPFPHPNTHNKRCPKAQRLDLRSDQSPSRPMNGRFPDKSRQALYKRSCHVSAPPIGRNGIAPSGDAQEHGVKLLHRAIAPFSDSTVVTIGKLRSTNAGRGSPLPSPRVVEHFRWSRLPQSENFSRLVHVPSGVWGCRRVDAGVDRPQGRTPRIGTGVADIMHKPSGTFHPLPSSNRQNANPNPTTEQLASFLLPRRGRSRACPSGVGWWGVPRTANWPDMPSHTAPFTLSFRCPARSKMSKMRLGVRLWRESGEGCGASGVSPTPREIPRNPIQAQFNQNSYEFNQRSINLQSIFNQNPTPPHLNKTPVRL